MPIELPDHCFLFNGNDDYLQQEIVCLIKPKIFTICPPTATIRQPVVKTSRLYHLTQIINTHSASDSQCVRKGWVEEATHTYNPSSQEAEQVQAPLGFLLSWRPN